MAQFVWNLVRNNIRATVLVTSICGAAGMKQKMHCREGDTTGKPVKKGEKRKNYLSKPDYFMGIALLAAQRSKDPSTQVGTCIVNKEGRIVGVGYNGMPKQNDNKFTWNRDFKPDSNSTKEEQEDQKFLEGKYAYVCHAVLNAIVNKNSFDVHGCTIYTVLFPCNKCTELITQSGISKVVYLSDTYRTRQENKEPDNITAAKTILDIAGIKYLKFDLLSARPEGKGIQINLKNIDPKDDKGEQEIFMKEPKADQPQKANSSEENLNQPRTDNLSENDYFMAVAKLSALRSKDKVTQVGACIVSEDKKVVGLGYNGMPNGCSDDVMHWGKIGRPLDNKHLYVCHAELNAIMNKNRFDVKGCSMYVTLFPCNECAKLIVQSGIKEVFYLVDRPERKKYIASKKILDASQVIYHPFKADQKELFLDFDVMEKRTKAQEQSEGESASKVEDGEAQ